MLQNSYRFVLIYDVKNGNPNGDPDMDNQPRQDYSTGHGIITDVCIKRKIRNYITMIHEKEMFIKTGNILNDLIKDGEKNGMSHKRDFDGFKKYMCEKYNDNRTFGAVLSTGDEKSIVKGNDVNVRGPVQINFGDSADPVEVANNRLTRCCVTNKKDEKKERTLGDKQTIYYGLYSVFGSVDACLAEKTGFSEDDLELLWEALQNMFNIDNSASKGLVIPRKLVIFKFPGKYGNNRAVEWVKVQKKDSVENPRSYDDYIVTVDEENIPENVEVITLL